LNDVCCGHTGAHGHGHGHGANHEGGCGF
jgi:hypothetical protein